MSTREFHIYKHSHSETIDAGLCTLQVLQYFCMLFYSIWIDIFVSACVKGWSKNISYNNYIFLYKSAIIKQ